MEKGETLDTIWEVPDDLWAEIQPLVLKLDPPSPRGANVPIQDLCSMA